MVNDRLLDMPFDQFQRYRAVEEVIGIIKAEKGRKRLRILDVGGYYRNSDGQDIFPLREFLPEEEIIVLDVVDCQLLGYVQADATAMPFRKEAFDVLVSQDVLEHIAPEEREKFLDSLFQTTSDFVILGAYQFYTASLNK